MPLTVAIVGRPNVGKSTLFNRLVGQRLALVDDEPGVTRDRREGEGRLGDLDFTVIDTAGFEEVADDSLKGRMRRQTEAAITGADLCLFMYDARTGITPVDHAMADVVRVSGKPVVLLANKAESRAAEPGVLEGYSLGLGEPVPISAEHGIGMGDIADILKAAADNMVVAGENDVEAGEIPDRSKPIRIAIVGRPNAGKSTLVNTMIGAERMLTGPEAGITRDSIAVPWQWRDREYLLHDTAGLRRRARVQEKLEKLSVADALRAIRFAEVVILLMDATAPLERQDRQIADLVAKEGRVLILALNKWDLVSDKSQRLKELSADLDETLQQVRGVALVPISATTGAGLEHLMEAVAESYGIWNRRVPTAALNRWLAGTTARHPPPAVSGRRIRLKYLSQTAIRPPTFYLDCSRPDALPESYKRYIINGIREDFNLYSVPIRLMLRRDGNPYAKQRSKRR